MTPRAARALHLHVEVIFNIVYLLTGCFCVQTVLSFVSQAPSCSWSLKPVSWRNPNRFCSGFFVTAFFSAITFLAPLQLEGDEFLQEKRFSWGKLKFSVWVSHLSAWSVLHPWFYSLLHLFFPLGTCWPSLWGSESLELVLGGWRFHLQVFWSDSDWSLP